MAMGAAQAPAPAKTGPFLPNAGAQCIPVDKLENGTLAFPASACVLLGLGCNPGPKRTSSAERPPGRRAMAWRHSAPPRGQLPCWVPDLSRQGLKPEHHWQADKVCRRGSPWVPPPGAPSSNALFQPALEFGHRQAPGALPGCLPAGGGVPVGSARPPSPRAPAPPAPAARQLCAPVGPGGHRQTAGSAAGSPAGPCSVSLGAPRKGKGGRRGYQALVRSNSACQALAGRPEPWLSPAAPAPALGPRPAAPSGPRLAWAPGRR